jgi:hypothetical protein
MASASKEPVAGKQTSSSTAIPGSPEGATATPIQVADPTSALAAAAPAADTVAPTAAPITAHDIVIVSWRAFVLKCISSNC